MKAILAWVLAAFLIVPAAAKEASRDADRRAVEAVLQQYKQAVERLDASGTQNLFASDSQIFENGGSEGSYATYLAHHLGPELGHFRSFKFSDYKMTVRLEGPIALVSATYRYRIEPKAGATIEGLGVTTSVLKKIGGRWTILSMHSSARRPRAS